MPNLECTQCGYKFKRPGMIDRCPYCSKEGAVKLRKTAQDFLDETFAEKSVMEEEKKNRQT